MSEYKNLIELKDDVSDELAKEIRQRCFEAYNKGEQRVELVMHSTRKFDMVTDRSGKSNLMVGVAIMTGDDIFTDNAKMWYWYEENEFESGDILAVVNKLKAKGVSEKWAV